MNHLDKNGATLYAFDLSMCRACGIGKYCPTSGMAAALDCEDGTYNNETMKATECKVC